MKTNQIMIRPMGEFEVTQRTSDGFFNATELLRQWNDKLGMQKTIAHFFENEASEELIQVIMEKENFKCRDSVYLKSRGKYNGGTWMHPVLFIDFAMWINPKFKYDVIKFVYDEMIKFRNEAGDNHREMAAAIQKIVSKDFMPTAIKKVSEAINWVVFNQHEKMIRNKFGEENKQRELAQLERKVTDLINDGFIVSYESLLNYLRRQYHMRNSPKIFLPNYYEILKNQ